MKKINKILRDDLEYLIGCDVKGITPDVKDDIDLTLQYIDELENKIKELEVELNTCMIERNNYLSKMDAAIKLIKKNSNYNITLVQNALIGKDIDDLLNILGSEE